MLQVTAVGESQWARALVVWTLHASKLNDSDIDEKPLPRTVSGVPPSESTRDGHTELTDIARSYVYDAPPPTPTSPYC